MPGPTPTHYEVLGIPESASPDEVKKAYRKKALETHPDKNPDPGAAELFKQVNEANQVLSDEDKKADYDRNLAKQRRQQESAHSAPRSVPKTPAQPAPQAHYKPQSESAYHQKTHNVSNHAAPKSSKETASTPAQKSSFSSQPARQTYQAPKTDNIPSRSYTTNRRGFFSEPEFPQPQVAVIFIQVDQAALLLAMMMHMEYMRQVNLLASLMVNAMLQAHLHSIERPGNKSVHADFTPEPVERPSIRVC